MTRQQREYTRHRAALKVDVRTREGWRPCTTLDVSRKGLFVKSDARFDLQRVIQLRLNLPEGDPVTVLCQVRRHVMQVGDKEPVPGIGVAFFSMPVEVQARWDLYVLSLSEADRQSMADAVLEDDADLVGRAPVAEAQTATGAAPRGPAARGGGARRDPRTPPESGVGRARPSPSAARERGTWTATAGPRLRARPAGRAARQGPTYAADASQPAVIIRVRPRESGRLKRIIEQRLWGEPLTLRTGEDIAVNQPVELVLVHHKTDAEFVLEAACGVLGPRDRTGHANVKLSFPPVTDALKASLSRFLRTGTRDQQHMGRGERALLERRRERAERNPSDPQALLEFGWAVLAVEEQAEAASEVFLRALALAERREDVHHALGICYALMGRTDLAYQFIRSTLRLQDGGHDVAPNATAAPHRPAAATQVSGRGRGAGPSTARDEIGLIRRS